MSEEKTTPIDPITGKKIKEISEEVGLNEYSEEEVKSNDNNGDGLNGDTLITEPTLIQKLSSVPDNLIMAAKSAWIGRERGLAVFAGVFLASLVITTVVAYGVGLSQAFLQFSLEEEIFDVKMDFSEDPGDNVTGRTNDSVQWESVCDELANMEEFSDCGLVFGRQGVRVDGFFDQDFIIPQPLNVANATGITGDWGNVSWAYPEASNSGPPINDGRILRFYGEGIWDGEFAERHSKRLIYGSWPSSADAETNRSVVLPSQIASAAGVSINDTIDILTFTYVTDYLSFEDSVAGRTLENCAGEEVVEQSGFSFCRVEMTVTNLKVSAVYKEGGAGNPTLLFNPVMISESVLNDSQRLILMDNDHGYLGLTVDRNLLPTTSTADATEWLEELKKDVEGQNYTNSGISVEYNDLISGTITFLNIFLGIIQVFDYVLMIPIVILSFSVLIYGLVLSLEQRKKEISIQRVIGGTEKTLSRIVLLELIVISMFAWFFGYIIAMLATPDLVAAVGFMEFDRDSEFRVNPVLGIVTIIFIIVVTVGVSWLFGRSRTKEFLSIEIDEGVRKVAKVKEQRTWLHLLVFVVGLLAALESFIQSNNSDSDGLVGNFIFDALLLLFGPFMLWIGGALILGRIGAAGPRILGLILGWTAALKDIKRGLRGSGSSESVNRLAVVMILTLSVVTLAAIQGVTGSLVDERTASAQVGADMQVQFDSPVTEEVARAEMMLAIDRVESQEISNISAMTSVGDIFTSPSGEGALIRTWVLFDNHEKTLIWDNQAIPGDDQDTVIDLWSSGGFTVGEEALDVLDLERKNSLARNGFPDLVMGGGRTIEYTEYSFGGISEDFTPIIIETITETDIEFIGVHEWVPGLGGTEAAQSIVIGESAYRELVGDENADNYESNRWFFEFCDETDNNCAEALRNLNVEITNGEGVSSADDWSNAHKEVENSGGLIFGTPGLLSLQFLVAALASVASAFVFLSLVLSQRKKELAIFQAIGASPNQVVRIVLFEIMSIIVVSMVLGIALGITLAQAFSGLFGIFSYIFQIFLGTSTPIDRNLVWPWGRVILVNIMVFVAVIAALLFTTRRALKSDLAVVLKGE